MEHEDSRPHLASKGRILGDSLAIGRARATPPSTSGKIIAPARKVLHSKPVVIRKTVDNLSKPSSPITPLKTPFASSVTVNILGALTGVACALVCVFWAEAFKGGRELEERTELYPSVFDTQSISMAAMEYRRPDLSNRIISAAALPTRVERKVIPVSAVHPKHEVSVFTKPPSSKQLHKPLSYKHQVDKVYSIIKTHSPKHGTPRQLAEAIVREAAHQRYDPLFVAAVIKSESTFNAMARSHKGAQGLMQIMPKTGAWLAKKEEMPKGSLTDTGYNLKLGITYLKHLEEMYHGNRVFVLIAYNWGPGHVASASEGKRRVPSEVVTYAVKIMNDFRRWSA